MGQSTDGQICYGIKFDEDTEFPWEDEKWGNWIEDWWYRGILGYKPPFEIWDESRDNYIGGMEPSKERKNAYYAAYRKFKEENPSVPVEEVNYCSGDYPMTILAIPGSRLVANRGFPKSFDPANLKTDPSEIEKLKEFCEKHELEGEGPCWWLSSYWG